MNSCYDLIKENRNTYLFKSGLYKIIFFMDKVVLFPGARCYLSSDRDDGKIYLNVEFCGDDVKLEKFVKDWILFNQELVYKYHLEVADEVDEVNEVVIEVKKFVIRLK